jgi:hypothetical protein
MNEDNGLVLEQIQALNQRFDRFEESFRSVLNMHGELSRQITENKKDIEELKKDHTEISAESKARLIMLREIQENLLPKKDIDAMFADIRLLKDKSKDNLWRAAKWIVGILLASIGVIIMGFLVTAGNNLVKNFGTMMERPIYYNYTPPPEQGAEQTEGAGRR